MAYCETMRNKLLGVFTAVVIFASIAVGVFVYLSSRPSSSVGSGEGFDLAAVEAPKPPKVVVAPVAAPVDAPPPDYRLSGIQRDASLGGPAPAGTAAPRPGTPASASPAPAAAPETAQRQREKAWLAAHGKEVEAYHAKLDKIAMQFYKTHPVVRDVDRAFAGMSRYMAVKQQFDKDRDPYAFARGALALPEVRAEIARRVADPAVWGAAIGMMTTALKNPPPPSLYNEAKNFMTGDQKVAGYITEFTGVAANNVGAIVKGIPPGTDTSGLEKLAHDVAPGAPLPPH